ncbi:NDP-glycosyltransferase YjiC-like [Dermatophagoides pteronyssinus]|uniref:NDP-glycosyltransferase YjiC-like n=1 Tax=Dermatophagoides pteronyssinus TaxID=6956 RepID=UPI003F66817F
MSDQKKSLKIFIYTSDGVGHINACVGLGQALIKYGGHRIYFICSTTFAGTFKQYGFEEIVMTMKQQADESNENAEQDRQIHPLLAMKMRVKKLQETGLLSDRKPIEKLDCFSSNEEDSIGNHMFNESVEHHQQIVDAVERERPDLIIVDHFIVDPFILYEKIPWAFSWSGNPTFMFSNHPDIPPPCSGYPSNDRTGWDEFRQKFNESFKKDIRTIQNKLNKHFGYPELNDNNFFPFSPYLNFYGYPKELDYTDIIELPENIIQLDAFCRQETNEPYELPDEFKSKLKPDDKLIYVSLGSMGSIDVDLMKRIVQALSKSPYKYIVSKGALHEEYDLADNMWGEAYLPQIRILPLVDMVITHGGNNTVTETVSYGKPMLVMPLFADQYDNAQRIREKGFGDRIETYRFEDDKLIQLIDKILNDNEIHERCRKAAERIRSDESKINACRKIEKFFENFYSKK